MGGIEAGRNINMELEGGGKKAGWRREESWMEEGRKLDGGGKIWKFNLNNIFCNAQHSHLDHRAEFAGPQPSHILWN